MAGRGPTPKSDDKRARRNKVAPMRVIIAEPAAQPDLPRLYLSGKEADWPRVTLDWWDMWAASPLSAEFSDTDWSVLMDTAAIHARFWLGDASMAGELRLRMREFGATPEARARLRITFAQADAAESVDGSRQSSSRARHDGLRLAE